MWYIIEISNYIIRSFRSRSPSLLYQLFCIYVRPILEYASPVWNPSSRKDILAIERVQRRFTRIAFARKDPHTHYSYVDRLIALQSHTLESRRVAADLTLVYKIVYGDSHISPLAMFSVSNRAHISRQHSQQL